MGEQKEVEIIASHGYMNTRYPKKVQLLFGKKYKIFAK